MKSFLTRSVVIALSMGPFSIFVGQVISKQNARAKSSFVPAPGISSASLVLRVWERPDRRSLS
jgi:hypothetical protein